MKGFCIVQSFTDKDLDLFKKIAKLDQATLKSMLHKLLSEIADYTVYSTDLFIAAEGNIPIVLVAHMDTVFNRPPKDFYFDEKRGALWSPEGLGADDRAGIFAILKIIGSGLHPHILFTCDEETGGAGAIDASQYGSFFGDIRYVIELDRRGSNDCVFYDCNNTDFIQYVETFGFKEAIGTFSDISIICPVWKTAGVNLSVGYYNEHTICEILMVDELARTISRVKEMLTETDIPKFVYIPTYATYAFKEITSDKDGKIKYVPTYFPDVTCKICRKRSSLMSMIEVEDEEENISYYCGNCFDKHGTHVAWCYNCGYAYEVEDERLNTGLCFSCRSYPGGYNFGFKENEGYC